jgi:hypothetical protein
MILRFADMFQCKKDTSVIDGVALFVNFDTFFFFFITNVKELLSSSVFSLSLFVYCIE